MNSPYRTAGRAAIASGILGMIAYFSLIGFLLIRNQDSQNGTLPIRVHDSCVIFQFLFLIPVSIALFKIIKEQNLKITQAFLNVGIGALCFTVLFLLLIFPKILADTLYMAPQGVFGAWVIVACWRLKVFIPQWLRWFGIIVGSGLILAGLFPIGYGIFVDNVIFHIPAPSDEVMDKIPAETTANIVVHLFLYIGSFIGVLTLPVWTILIGVRLLRSKIE
ncbi:hypothetical protein [Mucilaginibacter ginsenosidivorax]|uniref:Uncharacterized protein n=1 Tax=Mucilaginibacter ginsenosidivorax TaxID=862126 RepID=A0A5B8VXD0_9SPHI|nr:hypothetical protein [Mucilaginibacter ginsenosidivorax]QEC75973.1 hypothetical protein FSB76_08445 [Mucilaginibacter ginsenosidivorax]